LDIENNLFDDNLLVCNDNVLKSKLFLKFFTDLGSVLKGSQTTFETGNLEITNLTFVIQELHVIGNEIKVILGSGEVLSLVDCLKHNRVFLHRLMDHHDMISYWLSKLFVDLDFLEEVGCDITKRINGPWEEPINECVRNKTRETTATESQEVTSRGHAHNNMHVFAATVHEVLPSELFGLRQLLGAHFFVEGVDKTILFFFGEETGNHTDGQDVVD
jgi:hypothetical protein